ncbi:phytanoyl-CoA dioxygenase family protein [Chitinophaga lutea]|nr:phytanoyl-CoA dioxygenase family protein [Chitinophaga lutea]
MRLLHVELKVGDSLIFHPNLLHRSGANLSEHQRVPPERAASRNRATLF